MKKFIKSFVLLLFPVSLLGQLTPVSDQYILNPMTINPAYAGRRGVLNIAAFYKQQWVGITGSPETVTLAGDAPLLDEKIGLGLIIVKDKVGVTKKTQFLTNYSYKIDLNEGNLSFGLGAGLITTNTKWSDLVVIDPGDENYLIDSKVFVIPDFRLGVYYSNQNYFAGFSIPRLLDYNFNSDKNKYSVKLSPDKYEYLINTGYVYDISAKARVYPSLLISYSPGEKLLYDINTHFSYVDKFWVGFSYRNKRSLAGFCQFQVNNQLRVAYTYNFDFGKLRSYSSGSHEIMLRYEFRYKVDVVTPLNF